MAIIGSDMPSSAGMPDSAGGVRTKGKKKVVVRRVGSKQGSASSSTAGTPRQGVYPTPESSPLKQTGAERVMSKREAGRLRSCDVLGDMTEFETGLQATLPPQPPPPDPLNKDTYDLGNMPAEIAEATMLAPDDGVAVIAAYETLLSDRRGMTTRATELTQRRAGAGGTELYGTKTWGNNYPDGHPTGRLMEERRIRALRRWEQQQREWRAQEERLVEMTGQPASSLAMSKQRAVEYRTNLQTKTQLMKSMPLQDKGLGPAEWYMSLRDGWTRQVQIGNVFSGLFVNIEERPVDAPGADLKPVEMVQQLDLDRPGTPSASMSTRAKLDTLRDVSLTARGRNWAQGGYLQYRKKLYARNLKLVVPREPEFEALHVKGVGVEGAMWERAHSEVTIQDVEAQLARHNPDALAALQAARAAEEQRQREEEEERRRALVELMEADKSRPREGPSVWVAEERLVMVAEAGEVSRASLRIENNGSTALFYEWSGKMRDLPQHARAGGAYDEERFYLSDQSGVLLPQQVKYFDFSFKSDQPGIYEALWSLSTHPTLPSPCPHVALRGIASTRDARKFQRRLLDAALNERVKAEEVGVALERVLRNVGTPPREERGSEEGALLGEEAVFYSLNGDHPAGALYYRADLHRAMAEFHVEAHALRYPEPTEEELAELAKTSKGGKSGKEAKGFEGQEDVPPAEWDGRVASLEQMVASLAEVGEGKEEAVRAVQSKLASLMDLAKTPATRGQMHRHAMRHVVQRMADAVADRGEAVLMEAARREEEREAALAEEEGEVKKKAAPVRGKKGVPELPKYDKEEFLEMLEEATSDGVLSAGGQFQRSLLSLSKGVAAHLDAKVADVSEQLASTSRAEGGGADVADLAWRKFAVLRTRRGLRLPGGDESWKPGEVEQLEFSDDEEETVDEGERKEEEGDELGVEEGEAQDGGGEQTARESES